MVITPPSLTTNSKGFAELQSTDNSMAKISFELKILPCPFGFNAAQHTGLCICNRFIAGLRSNISCDIQAGTITLPDSTWYGIPSNGSSSLSDSPEAISFSCPLNYCISTVFNISITDSLCANGRTGTMCGSCADGLSSTFGSDECVKCSNYFLLVLIGYGVAGVVLVFMLFVFRITISDGVVGGVIFFANMSSKSLHFSLLTDHMYTLPVRVALSMLNLSTGFTLCFYDGMTNTVKAGMRFVFPIYLCVIVLVLVIVSRCSVKVANLIVGSSVQVLPTIVHLSFAKLLLTSADILTMSRLIVSTGVHSRHFVWYFDGSVDYLTGNHLVLVIISLIVIVFIILPYLVFTLFASHLRRFRCLNLYLHPLIDAYHAQYKTRYGYWCGIRQCLMVLLYIMYSVLRGSKPGLMLIINIACIGGFLSLQMMLKPFKSFFVNCFESWLMFLLCFADLVTYFFIYGSRPPPTTLSSVIMSLLLLTYLFMVAGLFVWQVGKQCFSKQSLKMCASWKIVRRFTSSTEEAEQHIDSEIREPLLYDFSS